MNNITLSADKALIEQARRHFSKRGTTINAEFRKWLAGQAEDEGKRRAREYRELIKSLPKSKIGYKVSREEMNER